MEGRKGGRKKGKGEERGVCFLNYERHLLLISSSCSAGWIGESAPKRLPPERWPSQLLPRRCLHHQHPLQWSYLRSVTVSHRFLNDSGCPYVRMQLNTCHIHLVLPGCSTGTRRRMDSRLLRISRREISVTTVRLKSKIMTWPVSR